MKKNKKLCKFRSVDEDIKKAWSLLLKRSERTRKYFINRLGSLCEISVLMPKEGDRGPYMGIGPVSYSFFITNNPRSVEVILYHSGKRMFCLHMLDKGGELHFAQCAGPHEYITSGPKEFKQIIGPIENYLVTGVC